VHGVLFQIAFPDSPYPIISRKKAQISIISGTSSRLMELIPFSSDKYNKIIIFFIFWLLYAPLLHEKLKKYFGPLRGLQPPHRPPTYDIRWPLSKNLTLTLLMA